MEEKRAVEPTLAPSAVLALIQEAEKEGIADPLLQLVVATQAERMNQAAKILNLEWNGAYNENHVKAIAHAYDKARKLMRDEVAAKVHTTEPQGKEEEKIA